MPHTRGLRQLVYVCQRSVSIIHHRYMQEVKRTMLTNNRLLIALGYQRLGNPFSGPTILF